MTEAEKLAEKFVGARKHPDYQRAMATEPVTWMMFSIVAVAGLALTVAITLAFYPWDVYEKMPAQVKAVMMLSWLPTVGMAVGTIWLVIDAAGLAMSPGRHMLAVIARREETPAPYYIRLIGEDGSERDYRARRRAASVVKLRLLQPGDVGVAVFKGDICVEWVALPAHVDRVYDRR